MRRQNQHRAAEIAALMDTAHFIDRAAEIYRLENFVCDTSGSICEVVDPFDPDDPLLAELERHMLLVWIKGSEDHTAELVRRFDRAPKPMYYEPEFLDRAWVKYRMENGLREDGGNYVLGAWIPPANAGDFGWHP